LPWRKTQEKKGEGWITTQTLDTGEKTHRSKVEQRFFTVTVQLGKSRKKTERKGEENPRGKIKNAAGGGGKKVGVVTFQWNRSNTGKQPTI